MTTGINKGKLDPNLIMIKDATSTLTESNDRSTLYQDVFPLLMEHMYGHLKGKERLPERGLKCRYLGVIPTIVAASIFI